MIIDILLFSAALFVMWIIMADVRRYTEDPYHPIIQALALAYGFIFVIVDVAYNFTAGTIVFMQLPSFKAPTLSERLRNILTDSNELSWRWKLAYKVCKYAISPWDKGHCGIGLG